MIWDSELKGKHWSRISCATLLVWLYSAKCREGRLHCRCETPGRIAAGVLVAAALAQAYADGQSPTVKKLKGSAEFELYSRAAKDAGDPATAIRDLDEWTAKFPDSDYRDDRFYMYLQAYASMQPPQPARVVEYGARLMSRDMHALFAGPVTTEQLAGQPIRLAMVNVLLLLATHVANAPVATEAQQELGSRALKTLTDIAPQYFTPENRPEGTTEAQWADARADLESRTKADAIALALKPGAMAQAAKDCAGAEAAFSKAYFDHPDSGLIAYHLGSALIGCESGDPEKLARGLWLVAHAAAMDPASSGIAREDLPVIDGYLKIVYVKIHGSEQGLERLKRQASNGSSPPQGFKIPSEAEIIKEQQAEVERTNPQLAQWVRIRRLLDDNNGELYFAGQLKNNSAPQLWGKLVEARPTCHPRELWIAVPVPDAPAPKAQILLKLDKALAGQPETGSELRFDAVPSAFTREPFLLTMVTSPERIQGLKSPPCAPAGARSGVKSNIESKRK
jgi:hypothetical protein